MSNLVEELFPISLTSNNSNGFIVSALSSHVITYYMFNANNTGAARITNGGQSGWVKIKLPEKKSFNRIKLTFSSVYYSNDFSIEASNDDVNFTVLKSITGNTSSKGIIVDFENNEKYLYYRISTTKSPYNYVDIVKVEFYRTYLEFDEKSILKSKDKLYAFSSQDQIYAPKMTSNTAPLPYTTKASSVYGSYPAWKAFNNNPTDWGWFANGRTGWIEIDFGKETPTNQVEIFSAAYNAQVSPKNFKILGSFDGMNFDEIMSITEQVNWEKGKGRTFKYPKKNYRYYRIDVSLNNGGANYITIDEIIFSIKDSELVKIDHDIAEAVRKYGTKTIEGFSNKIESKKYIKKTLDDQLIISIDRKPLNIKFE